MHIWPQQSKTEWQRDQPLPDKTSSLRSFSGLWLTAMSRVEYLLSLLGLQTCIFKELFCLTLLAYLRFYPSYLENLLVCVSGKSALTRLIYFIFV